MPLSVLDVNYSFDWQGFSFNNCCLESVIAISWYAVMLV